MKEEKIEYTRISLRIPKSLLNNFDQHAKEKGYQTRNKAILDLIKDEITK